jgi:bifunctional oligoribonuclease and PAP phosphatase NrnA
MKKKRALDSMKAVMEAIRKHRRFSVTSHVNPEGDALGSALALASLLNRLGKQAVVATDGGLPAAFRFFPPTVKVTGRSPAAFRPEVAVWAA